MPSAARSPPSLKFVAPMRTLRAVSASVTPLLGLLSSCSDPHPLYDLAEIGVRHARNECTTSAETTVRMRPFCVFGVRRNAHSFSAVLHMYVCEAARDAVGVRGVVEGAAALASLRRHVPMAPTVDRQ